MADFHHLDDSKEIWLAVKARFAGNKESKKMRKTMLKQAFSEFSVSKEEGLHKGYDRSLEIDVKGRSSYGSRSTTVAPTHSAFIGDASTNTKMVYSNQLSYSSSISYTPAPSGSIMKYVLHSFVAENKPTQQLAYEDFEQISEVKTEEPKAMVSVDSMLNWNEHDVENKTKEAKQVYGLMAGFESNFTVHAGNAIGGVNPTAADPKTNDSFPTVDVKLLPKSDVKEPSLTNGLPSCSFKENVKPLRNLSSVPAGSRNSSASTSAGRSIPAASRNQSASIHAGRSILDASRNISASIHADRSIPAGRINKPAPFPVDWSGIYDHMSMNKGCWGSAVKSSADTGIVDSGCSRSMTGNKENLDDFLQVKGGTVTFGGGDGKITGKGTIRTSKLNFENVYYVEELQNFNLQEEGINYDEVFAPVARIEAIRLLLAFASYMGFMVYQIDVKSAFLYKEIEEEVHIILVQVYIDDIIFGSTNKAWCDKFEVLMKGEFEISDMGELTFFLGLQVKQLPDGIFISQDKYVKNMLKKFDMESVRTATTPYEVPKHKSKDDPDDSVNVYLFRSMIASLMYLTASMPDIMFAVSACSRHQCKKQTIVATSSIEAKYVAAASFYGQVLLLVVLVRADDLVPAGSCIIPTGSYSFMLWTWFLLLLVHADEFVPAGRCIITTVAAGVAAAHDVLPPIVPPTHSSSSIPGPSSAPQPSPTREPTPIREPTPVRGPTPCPVQDPTPDSPRPPSPPHYPRSEESNEALPTLAAIAAGGAEDSAALTALSLKLDRCLNRVTSLENKLDITKKILGGALLKLVTRVRRLKGLLQQRKQRLVLFDSEGEDATPTEQDINLVALHMLAITSLGGDSSDKAAGHDAAEVPVDTTMPFRSTSTMRRRLRKPFTSSASAHVPENIPIGVGIPAAATTIPTGSSMDAAVHGAAAHSSSIPTVDKGKAPMVDDSLPTDLLSEQERILKNLYDYQLGEDLAKKLHIEQEAEFARQQEELAQKAQAERLLGDDVTEDNMNERLGMLLLRKRRELAKQRFTFRPQPTLDAPSAKRANQGVPQVPAASSQVPASIPAAPSFAADVSVSTATTLEVPAAESCLADTPTTSAHVFVEHYVAASTPSSSRKRRKHIAKKRVTPIVDIADDALIKFDSDSGSDDDPLPYTSYVGWEMVPSPLGSIQAYYDMVGHTKHFTSLHELLHLVEKTGLQKLLGVVDNLYQREDPDTFSLIL
nr:retrotransposon protein, putative, unclassified [Tanacetum cinerariifolium]